MRGNTGMRSRVAGALWGVAVMLFLAAPAGADDKALAKALGDTALWGPDLPSALATLRPLRRLGVNEVEIHADHLVARDSAKTPADAKRTADALSSALAGAGPKWNAAFDALARRVPAKSPLQAQVVARYEDDLPHVAVRGTKLQFLAAGLTLATVRQRLGAPEKTATIAVQGIGDRRPVVLTIHSYLGGALGFAESDQAPDPHLVDRVIIDVRSVDTSLFQGAP